MLDSKRILFIILIVTVGLSAFAQSRYKSTVIIVSVPADRESTNLYGEIITGFMLTVLQNEGLPATEVPSFEHELTADGLIAPGDDELSAILLLGAKNSADYVLFCAYEARGNEILLYTHMVDVATGELVVTTEERARPILMMDGAIYRSLDRILAAIESRLTAIPEDEIIVADTGDGGDSDVVHVEIPAEEPPKQFRLPGFSLTTGVGALGSLGKAADYFQIGIMPLIQFGYGFNTVIGQLSIGALIGTSYFEASGAISKSQNILSPFGLELGYMSNGGGFLDVSVSVSGGGSVLAMNPNQTGYLIKIIPYGMAGFGFIALPAQVVSIMADVSAIAFFDTELIIGYIPAIHVSIHF